MIREYYKRIKYKKEEIDTKAFDEQSLKSENSVTLVHIDEYLSGMPREEVEGVFDFSLSPREKNCGLGENYVQDVKDKKNSGFYLNVPANTVLKNEVLIRYDLKDEGVLYDQSLIEIGEDAKARVVIYYGSDESSAYRNGLLKIVLGRRADLELIKVQRLSEPSRNFESSKCTAYEKSKFTLHQIDFGAGLSATTCSTYMPEEWAEVTILPLYFAQNKDRFDLEQNLIINGKNSLGIVNAKGAMKDKGLKVFRGNVFLNKGCKRSIGRFANSDILLSEGIKAQSIPTILCDEDDVMGEHAASFEAINRKKLYYLMSRGFTEQQAKKLLVESSFRPIFNKIENDEIRGSLLTELDRRL